MKRFLALAGALLPLALGWQDCDVLAPDAAGPFKTTLLKNLTSKGHAVYLQYPSEQPPAGSKGWPAVVFMHGMTLGWEWYERHVAQWASHGFAVAVPFVKSVEADDGLLPVTETDSTSIYAAAALLKGLADDSVQGPADMPAKVDFASIGLVGHSMGGEDTMRAAAGLRVPEGMEPLPSGAVKVAIAQHPSLCTFPPPHPYSITKEEIDAASRNATLLLFTAENDRAFLPGTPSVEHSCWEAAKGPAMFASFKKTVCETYPPCENMSSAHGCTLKVDFVGVGHMCACDAPGLDTWTSPELKWVTAALRSHLHHGNSASSYCSKLLVGDMPGSFKNSPDVATLEMHFDTPGADRVWV